MANAINKEQKVQAVVFKGERRYMMDVIGKMVLWGMQMDQIAVEDNITSIHVQAPQAAIKAMHKALQKDGQDSYLGLA